MANLQQYSFAVSRDNLEGSVECVADVAEIAEILKNLDAPINVPVRSAKGKMIANLPSAREIFSAGFRVAIQNQARNEFLPLPANGKNKRGKTVLR